LDTIDLQKLGRFVFYYLAESAAAL